MSYVNEIRSMNPYDTVGVWGWRFYWCNYWLLCCCARQCVNVDRRLRVYTSVMTERIALRLECMLHMFTLGWRYYK